MANITKYTAKDGSDTWRVRYRLHRRSCSKTFADQRSAEAFGEMVDRWGAPQALEFIKEPTAPRVKKTVTVADCIERYAALRQSKTAKNYRDLARVQINPALGTMPIGKLTPEAVQLWVNGLDCTTGTIRLLHTILSGALTEAVARGEIESNPAAKATKTKAGIRLPRKRNATEPVFLTKDEYELILKSVLDRYKLIIEFLAATGCRIGEAVALKSANVNMRTGKVRFNETFSHIDNGVMTFGPTKTVASTREIAVPRRVLDQLDLSGEYVFSNKGGGPLSPVTVRGAWRRAGKASGLPEHRRPRIHDIRHTHASWLLEAGVSLHAIKERLGHSDVMTTLSIYGHAAEDSESRILKLLD